jgi:cell division protein FtsQ
LAKIKYKSVPKSAYKKQKARSHKRLIGRMIRWCTCLVILTVIGYGTIKVCKYIYKLPCFAIAKIQIEGNKVLNDSQICQLAGLYYQQNIFDLNSKLARQAIESHPYVRQVSISKRLPNTVYIRAQERNGFALVKSGGIYIVDDEGIVLEELKGVKLPDLPIISGVAQECLKIGAKVVPEALHNGLHILKCLRENQFLTNVSEVNVKDPYCRMFYTLSEGIEVLLGEGEIMQKLQQMKTVWHDLNARIKEVESLDLRYKDMVVVRFRQPKSIVQASEFSGWGVKT